MKIKKGMAASVPPPPWVYSHLSLLLSLALLLLLFLPTDGDQDQPAEAALLPYFFVSVVLRSLLVGSAMIASGSEPALMID